MPLYFTQWEQFQGGAGHQGYVPGALNAASLSLLWSRETYGAGLSSNSEGPRGAVIIDGDVYATALAPTGQKRTGPYLVSRFDGDSGELEWQESFAVNDWSGISSPSVAGGTVYVHRWGHSGSSGSTEPEDFPALIGLDQASGTQQFETRHAGQWGNGSRPTVIDDQVFAAGGYYGGLDAYGADGGSDWFHKVNMQYGWIPAADEENVYVYMGEASASPGPSVGSLFVVDRETGNRTATITHPSSDGTFRANLQTVFLGDQNDAFALTRSGSGRTLVRFDLANESILWEKRGAFSGNGAVANGIVAIPDGDRLLVLDQTTGRTLWFWRESGLSNNVILTDSHAFVNTDSGVHAIDLVTRTSVWSVDVQGSLALDDDLLVISNDTGIYVYRTDGSATSVALPENSADATVVTTLDTEDLGYGSLVYAITEGNTQNAFAIDSATGNLVVATSTALDFETTPTFDLVLTVSDGTDPSRSQQKRLEVRLTDVAEVPPVIEIQPGSIFASLPENSAALTPVGSVITTNEDQGTMLRYSITGGNSNNAFFILADTGAIFVSNAAALDFETQPRFELEVTVSNGGFTDVEILPIQLIDEDENLNPRVGHTNLLWHHAVSGEAVAWFMKDGAATGAAALGIVADRNWELVGSGEFNGDQQEDLIWQHKVAGEVVAWFMDGDQPMGGAILDPVAGSNWHIAGTADFNGDDHTDLLQYNSVTGEARAWYLGNDSNIATTNIGSAVLGVVPDLNWTLVGAADVNGDRQSDLLWHHRTSGEAVAWLMDGSTPTSAAALGTVVDSNWVLMGASDLNGDGSADLLWRHRIAGENVGWLMDGTTAVNGVLLHTVADPNWKMVV